MKRRDFLFAAAVAAAPRSSFDFSLLPNFCSHEHWGSIDSIGTFPGGYRADIEPGAAPRRRTGFMDLLLEPYFRGWLRNGGADLTKIAPSAEPGWETFNLLCAAIEDQRFTGVYQCTRRGILQLYGIDLDKLNRQTAEGFPVHSFATLLTELASRARVTYSLESDDSGPTFQQIPEPTPLQAKAYELLNLLPVTGN